MHKYINKCINDKRGRKKLTDNVGDEPRKKKQKVSETQFVASKPEDKKEETLSEPNIFADVEQ